MADVCADKVDEHDRFTHVCDGCRKIVLAHNELIDKQEKDRWRNCCNTHVDEAHTPLCRVQRNNDMMTEPHKEIAHLVLPTDPKRRQEYPLYDGLFAYFPSALAEVARVSYVGNEIHNPGEPLHWAREKSTDHENKILRHLVDSGLTDIVSLADGRTFRVRHSAYLAWRALAKLQVELESSEGAPRAPNATYPDNQNGQHATA